MPHLYRIERAKEVAGDSEAELYARARWKRRMEVRERISAIGKMLPECKVVRQPCPVHGDDHYAILSPEGLICRSTYLLWKCWWELEFGNLSKFLEGNPIEELRKATQPK